MNLRVRPRVKLKSLGFRVLKYIVIAFWHSIEASGLLSRFLGSLRAHNLIDLLQ